MIFIQEKDCNVSEFIQGGKFDHRKFNFTNRLGLVVQRVDNAIHWINHYPTDSAVCFVNTYPLDSDLSGG